jgi:hypothetical protein
VTEPVGVGLPFPPVTATVTVNVCAVVMLVADGVNVKVGVTGFTTSETLAVAVV